jgi:hypothetical protein
MGERPTCRREVSRDGVRLIRVATFLLLLAYTTAAPKHEATTIRYMRSIGQRLLVAVCNGQSMMIAAHSRRSVIPLTKSIRRGSLLFIRDDASCRLTERRAPSIAAQRAVERQSRASRRTA